MLAIILPVNGPPTIGEVPNKLSAWQILVGGDVERVQFGDDAVLYCNENGIAEGLPRNDTASRLADAYEIGLLPGDYIKGDVFIVGLENDEGDNHADVPVHIVVGLNLSRTSTPPRRLISPLYHHEPSNARDR